MRALLLATSLLNLTVVAYGQLCAASALAPLPDWGLPNIASATYVRVSGYGNDSRDGALGYRRETSGNAWLLEEVPGQSGRLLVGGAEEVDAVWTESRHYYPEGPQDLLAKPAPASRLRVTWRPAHLQRDLKLFDSYLATTPRIARGDQVSARLFLTAFQLQQRGDTNAAEHLVQSLLQAGATVEELHESTLDLVALQQLRSLNRTLQREGDWTAFSQGLEVLRDRFSRPWKFQPGLDLLIGRVRERLVPETAATGPVQRLGQRLEDVQALRSFGYNRPEVLLLLPETWRGTNVIADDPELEIWNLGLEAIPLLLALSDDPRLTRMDTRAARLSPDYGIGLLFPGRTPEDQYAQLPRPATRGEVATRLLNTMLPESVSGPSWKATSLTNVQNAARALYDRCAGGGPAALLVEYLDRRNSFALNELALQALRPHAQAGPVPRLEQFLSRPLKTCTEEDRFSFGAANLAEHKADYLARYAGWRGAEAQSLVERFAADLEAHAAELQSPTNRGWRNPKEEAEELDHNKSKLRQLAGELRALPLSATPAEVLDGRPDSNAKFQLAKLETIPAPESMGLILHTATKTEDAKKRLALANLLQTLSSNWTQTGDRPAPTLFADAWAKLLADDGTDPDNSVALVFLVLNEQLYAGTTNASLAQLCARQHGEAGLAFVRERVAARLIGTPEERLPLYPEQITLQPEERAALAEQLRDVATREEAAAVAKRLPLYQQAALPELLKEKPTLNEQLAPLALTIVQIQVERDPALQNELSAWVGKPATAELGEKLSQVIAEMVARTQRCDIVFFRRAHFGGCEISIRSENAKPSLGFAASVLARNMNQSAQWRTSPLPEERDWRTFTTSDPYTRRTFARALEAFFSSEVDAASGGLLRFQTRDAP
jgi:hypothetical protein